MHNHNVVLLLPGGIRKPSGKIVLVSGQWHFHVHAQSGWRLVASNAWGIQEDVLDHCRECGVQLLHIFDKGQAATYTISHRDLHTYAVAGYHRLWGRQMNVGEHHFTRTEGKVAAARVWVPDEIAEVVLHTPNEAGEQIAPENVKQGSRLPGDRPGPI